MRLNFPTIALLLFALASSTPLLRADEPAKADDPAEIEYFEKHIRPILVQHCYECHSAGAKELKGDVRLDTREAIRKGGPMGPAVVPGDPDASWLIKAVRYETEDLKMPPQGKLTEVAIAKLVDWVKRGAADPRDKPDSAAVKPAVHPALDFDGAAKHWSFQPVKLAPLPAVKQAAWPRVDFDRYVLARLEGKNIAPSPEADRRTLIRRLYYDLIGLPPSFEEVERFARDDSAQAYADLVDRLLAQPQFGERWARYWLDLSRYSDTKGYVFMENRDYPEAFKYRKWVIDAFNRDLPYDQFLLTQIAADRVAGDNADDLSAMGFFTLGRRFINNQNDIIDDRIDVLMRTTQALTVTCARCHDHKYDPIPTQDYYSLYGVFASSNEPGGAPTALRMADGNIHDVQVFLRGNPGNRGDVAPRRFLRVLAGEQRQNFKDGSGRLELAKAITARDNPLTARVWANRVWSHLIGRGLVRTPSDFGRRSEPPAHPDVLDALALQLMDEGWSTKKLIRTILLSATYRQASVFRAEPAAIDPENNLVWKMNRRRLDFEALRDSLIAAGGQLDPTIGGPSVSITDGKVTNRRTLYAQVDRQNLPGIFRAFDFATPDTHQPERFTTTVPQQSLYLLNAPQMMQYSERLAERAADQTPDTSERVRRLFRFAYARDPEGEELAWAQQFVATAAEPRPSQGPWRYGYGKYDTESQRVTQFTALPYWTGIAWQTSANLPDDKLGWLMLAPAGGHPDLGAERAVIRRWVAPGAGQLAVQGKLKHSSNQGDGIRGRIVSSRSGPAGEWNLHNQEAPTKIESLAVEAGDTIDFIVDCRETVEFDSFIWNVTLKLEPGAGGRNEWNATKDFRGPTGNVLGPWSRLAQVLLMSNEFAFVD